MKENINKIAVIGAGTMGHGIAQSFAQAGYQVSIMSRTQKTLDRAMTLIQSSLGVMAEEGILDKKSIPSVLSRITPTTSIEEAARDADLAFETMAEDKEAKKKVFADLDKYCPPGTLLASNATYLNIFDFVETSRPDKVLIAHWYAPPQIIPLVDVVKGPKTDMANVELMADILRNMDKKPAVFKKWFGHDTAATARCANPGTLAGRRALPTRGLGSMVQSRPRGAFGRRARAPHGRGRP